MDSQLAGCFMNGQPVAGAAPHDLCASDQSVAKWENQPGTPNMCTTEKEAAKWEVSPPIYALSTNHTAKLVTQQLTRETPARHLPHLRISNKPICKMANQRHPFGALAAAQPTNGKSAAPPALCTSDQPRGKKGAKMVY